jgi:hypothetical protein
MKSVIQESTSLAKAIEEGWKKAGKPAEFSVKIYQEAEYGFLGLGTKKKAKVCILFEDRPFESGYKGKRDVSKQVGAKPRELRSGEKRRPERTDRPDMRRRDFKDRPPRKSFEKRDTHFKKESPAPAKIESKEQKPATSAVTDLSGKKVINAFVDKEK